MLISCDENDHYRSCRFLFHIINVFVCRSVVMGSIATGLVALGRKEKDVEHLVVVQGMATLLICVAVLFTVYASECPSLPLCIEVLIVPV